MLLVEAYVSLVLSMVLYGSETWTMRKIDNKITNAAIKETTELTDLPSLIADRRHLFFGHIYPGIHLSYKHYIYPLMPLPVHLLPLTGSAHWDVHGELGFNRWKRTWVYPSVPANSRPWTARCRDRYDPQLVKRSSE